jgi:hypothetical protein
MELDMFGYHSLSCLGVGNGLFARHDTVLTTLVDQAAACGLNPQKNAKVTCLGERSRFGRRFLRPADLLLDDAGYKTCVDVTIVSPLSQARSVTLCGRVLGACMLHQATLKMDKHLAACNDAGYEFLPFALDVCGLVSTDSYRLLQKFARRSEAQLRRPYSELIASNRRRVSCAIQIGVADQLLNQVSFSARLYRAGDTAAVVSSL